MSQTRCLFASYDDGIQSQSRWKNEEIRNNIIISIALFQILFYIFYLVVNIVLSETSPGLFDGPSDTPIVSEIHLSPDVIQE